MGSPVTGHLRIGNIETKAIPIELPFVVGTQPRGPAKALIRVFFGTDRNIRSDDGIICQFGNERYKEEALTSEHVKSAFPATIDSLISKRHQFFGFNSVLTRVAT